MTKRGNQLHADRPNGSTHCHHTDRTDRTDEDYGLNNLGMLYWADWAGKMPAPQEF